MGSRGHQARATRTSRVARPGGAPALRLRTAAAALAATWLVACAPIQQVAIQVEPAPEEIFVDGEPVSGSLDRLSLRADRDHAVYLKRRGFEPRLVVLRSVAGGEEPRLEPDVVRARLRPRRAGGGDLRIETGGAEGEEESP